MSSHYHTRLNAYRIMWVLVLFDLPTDTKKDRKAYANFRKKLLVDGFQMFQFSIYMRHCPSRENADAHIKRVNSFLPAKGHVGIFQLTDKQFGMIELFYCRESKSTQAPVQQLAMF